MPEARCPPVSGPDALLALKGRFLMPCVYHFYRDPPQIVSGHGCTLVDHAGREYLDCYSGVTVMNAGHCNSDIIEPAIEQIRTLQHTTTIYLTEPILRLAQSLAEIAPGNLTRSFFCVSGSEAVEGAMLLATRHTGRKDIVAFTDSLHGRTRWAMNATGLQMWRADPSPLADVHHARFGDVQDLERVVARHPGQIAAIIGEPIQGNGGIHVPDPSFWKQVRSLCDQNGILLIFDEVQTGFNRTGRWFASERWQVDPDIMAVSKALGNGFPISAFIATDEVAASHNTPGASTHGGNPVCAAAALATLRYHETHDLAGNARQRGEQLKRGLNDLEERYPCADTPRGLGLMLGMPITGPDGAPDAERCDALLETLKDGGVLAGKTGPGRNVLTLMPPLVIDESRIASLLESLDAALAGV